MLMALVAPSILAADFARMGEALAMIKRAGASMVHLDVMDGHFASEITVGQPVIRSLRRATDLVLDVHLLIERPERFVGEFIEAGADRVAVQVESTQDLSKSLELIRARGAKAGVALGPTAQLPALKEILGDIDFLNLLTGEPISGNGDSLQSNITERVRQAEQARGRRRFEIQVEGNVDLKQVSELAQAGADIFVVGSAIFHNGNPGAKLSELIRRASESRQASTV